MLIQISFASYLIHYSCHNREKIIPKHWEKNNSKQNQRHFRILSRFIAWKYENKFASGNSQMYFTDSCQIFYRIFRFFVTFITTKKKYYLKRTV